MTRKNEAGNIMLLTALALTVLMGFMGLAIDMGMMRYQKRIQQTAADAAALAGANDLAYLGSGSVTCAGQNASTANGFTDTSGGGACANGTVGTCTAKGAAAGTVCVQVNNPPSYLGSSDPHSGDPNYVEVVVAAVHPTYFMGFLKIYTANVVARAEATDLSGGTTATNCMYTLGLPAKKIGVDPYGHTTLNATSCGIADNGDFNPTGNGLTVNSCSFDVSGGPATGPGANNVYCNNTAVTPNYNHPTAQNPLSKLTPPTVGTAKAWNSSNPVPGTYNGITIGSKQTVNFQPGIYVVTGNDFSCGGGATVTGYGVMFYFTNGATVNCQGNVNTSLGAPCSTSGCVCSSQTSQSCYCPTSSCPAEYDGILMYQDPNDTNTGLAGNNICPPPGSGPNTGPQLGGNDQSSYWGVLYFPGDQIYLTGNTGTNAGTINIAASISDSLCTGGNSTFNLVGTSGSSTPLPTLSNAILVE